MSVLSQTSSQAKQDDWDLVVSRVNQDLKISASPSFNALTITNEATTSTFTATTVIMPLRTIPTSTTVGTEGEVCYDANYIYIATGTNQWKRVAIVAW